MKKTSLIVLLFVLLAVCLTSCVQIAQKTSKTEPEDVYFTVSFEDAANVLPQNILQGDFAEEPAVADRTGFNFLGWFDEAGNPFDFATTPISGNITLFAKWEPVTFSVTFLDGEGKVVSESTVNYGDLISAPALNLGENYQMKGWYTEKGGVGQKFNDKLPVYADVTYYLHAIKGAQVTFNDEDGRQISSTFVAEGNTVSAPTAPDKSGAGKDFMGWFDAEGNAYDANATYTQAVVFTAKYDQYYIIKFFSDGVLKGAYRVKSGEVVPVPSHDQIQNAEFLGWFDEAGVKLPTPLTASANAVYNARYARSYVVDFVNAEGNVLDSQVVPEGGNATMPTPDSDVYYAYDLSKLLDIRENTTIVVGIVAKSEYGEKDYFISQDMINSDERVTFDGFNASWGALLWDMGQSFSFTEEFAGVLRIKPFAPADKYGEGQSITIEVAVDGIAFARFTIDGAFARQFYTVHSNLPAGVHTITITVVEMVGISSPDKYGCAVGLADIIIQEKLLPVVEHTVTFAGEGVDILAQTVVEGDAAQKPADPVREGFIFAGWLLDGVAYDFSTPVNGDITLTASWTESSVTPPVEPTEFTVTFVDAEGNTLATQVVAKGANASIPDLGTDSYYAYDLAALLNIQENKTITVTAVDKNGYGEKDYFISQDMINNDERVTFDGFNASWGALLWNMGQSFSFTEEFAGMLRIKPFAPADKYGEGQSITIEVAVDGYALARYVVDGAFARKFYTVHSNLPAGVHTITITVVEMVGISSPDKYGCAVGLADIMIQEKLPPVVEHTVTFAGEGVDIPAQTVVEGNVAQKPADPVREGFVFAGWLLDGVAYDFSTPVNGDITLTASWTEAVTPPPTEPTEFTVTFVDANGNVIATETVQEGGIATLPESNEYFYTFSPVDALYNITEDKTIVLGTLSKAGYEAASHSMKRTNGEYDIYFTVSSTSGNKADYGTTIYGDNQFVTFKDNMIGTINMYFSGAKLTEEQYIDFEVLLDGVVVNAFRVVKATATNIDLCHVSQYGEHQVTVRSIGSANLPEGNTKHNNSVVITGVNFYRELPPVVEHTVSFSGEGVDIPAQTVISGQVATKPADPVREGFVFAGWLFGGEAYDFSAPVTGDITLTASWTEVIPEPETFTVTFLSQDGTVLKTETVESGAAATAPEAPAVDGHTFAGWDKAFDNITGDLTVTATYTINKYTVTFVGQDGSVIATVEVEHGKSATAPKAPAVEGYTFTGWDVAFEAVTDNLTVQAQYQAEQVEEYEGTPIRTQAELAALATAAPGTYTLIKDLTLEGWTSIVLPAGVTFGGNNHTIKGLTTPLFSEVHGTVKNLKIADANVQGISNKAINNGVLAVKLFDGAKVSHVDIVDCSLSGYYVGAIAGQGEGNITIEHCTVSGTVKHYANTGKGAVGGILGYYQQPKASDPAVCKIENCTNSATLSSSCGSGNIGGIVGWYANGNPKNEMYISNCINEGDVTSTASSNNAGGIIGYGYRAGYIYIDNCINRGAITATKQQAGGIVGSLYSGTSSEPMTPVITNCINHGKVSAANGAGGIVGDAGNTGDASTFTIKNCINHGEVVSETSYAGGIAGNTSQNSGTFHAIGCSNYGKVTGVKAAGGILGYAGASKFITFEVNANYGVVICTDGIAGGMFGLSNAGRDYTFTVKSFLQAGTVQGKIAGGVIGAFEAQKTTTTYKENSSTTDVTLISDATYKITLKADACVISGNIVGTESAAIFIGMSYGNTAPKMTLSNILSDAQVTEKGVAVENPVDYYTMAYVPTAGDADLVGTENEGKTAYYAKKNTTAISYMVAYELSNTPVANSIEIGAVVGGINAPLSQVGSAAYILNQAASALEEYNLSWKNGESYPVISFEVIEKVEHTVTFEGEGVDLPAQTVADGGVAEKPADPVREGFIFAGWLLGGEAYDFSTPVTGDITLTASWTEVIPEPETHTVTFIGFDGAALGTVEVEHGNAATAPEAPIVPGYTFKGWDVAFENVTGDITVTAIYEAEHPTKFTVTFVDAEGNVIATEVVAPGGIATLPKSNEYFYTFSPVDALYNITEDKTIVLGKVARSGYTETSLDMSKSNANYADHFTVTDNSNNRITPATVLFLKGHSVTLKATMIGEVEFYISNQGGNLSEDQWFDVEVQVDGKVVNVFRVDASYAQYVTACYIGEYGEHEVKLTIVDFANMPADNHKRGNVVWMNSCRIFEVSSTPAPETHTVTFVGFDGAALGTVEVEHGNAATAPEAPIVPGYTFKGWDVAFESVTGDMTVTALYEINKYTVTFLGMDGAVIDTVEVEHGKAATAPEAPAVEGYTFTGWDVAFEAVTDNLTVNAIYEQNTPEAQATSYKVLHWTFGANARDKVDSIYHLVKEENPDIAILTGISSSYYRAYAESKGFGEYSFFAWGSSKSKDDSANAGEPNNVPCGGGVAVLYKTEKFTAGEFKHSFFNGTNAAGAVTTVLLTDNVTGVTIPVAAVHINIGHKYSTVDYIMKAVNSALGENASNAIIRIHVSGTSEGKDVLSGFTANGFACGEGINTKKEDDTNYTTAIAMHLATYSNGTVTANVSDIAAVEATKDSSKYPNNQKTNPWFYTVAYTFTYTVG